eukprot:Lankesteria_metandrocarpae@DN4822_c0_g1_i1.p1
MSTSHSVFTADGSQGVKSRTMKTFSTQHREKLAMGRAVRTANGPGGGGGSSAQGKARITVVVRKRPVVAAELARQETDILSIDPTSTVATISEPRKNVHGSLYTENHQFKFDRVYPETATNLQVYRSCVQPLVIRLFREGARCSCFAYGQTGSGKTYTMVGPSRLRARLDKQDNAGIWELAGRDIFTWLHTPAFDYRFGLCLSFFEIYCNKVYDLLNERKLVRALETKSGDVVVKDVTTLKAESVEELLECIAIGLDKRSTGSNSKNADSSRGHAILSLEIRNEHDSVLHGRLAFIDLAGSERGADTINSGRQTQTDGAGINRSLLALKECIRALDSQSNHIPFRDTELTKVLRDMFVGAKARTLMIANVSPASGCCEQTLNTVRYADRVKSIRTNCLPDIVDIDESSCPLGDSEFDSLSAYDDETSLVVRGALYSNHEDNGGQDDDDLLLYDDEENVEDVPPQQTYYLEDPTHTGDHSAFELGVESETSQHRVRRRQKVIDEDNINYSTNVPVVSAETASRYEGEDGRRYSGYSEPLATDERSALIYQQVTRKSPRSTSKRQVAVGTQRSKTAVLDGRSGAAYHVAHSSPETSSVSSSSENEPPTIHRRGGERSAQFTAPTSQQQAERPRRHHHRPRDTRDEVKAASKKMPRSVKIPKSNRQNSGVSPLSSSSSETSSSSSFSSAGGRNRVSANNVTAAAAQRSSMDVAHAARSFNLAAQPRAASAGRESTANLTRSNLQSSRSGIAHGNTGGRTRYPGGSKVSTSHTSEKRKLTVSKAWTPPEESQMESGLHSAATAALARKASANTLSSTNKVPNSRKGRESVHPKSVGHHQFHHSGSNMNAQGGQLLVDHVTAQHHAEYSSTAAEAAAEAAKAKRTTRRDGGSTGSGFTSGSGNNKRVSSGGPCANVVDNIATTSNAAALSNLVRNASKRWTSLQGATAGGHVFPAAVGDDISTTGGDTTTVGSGANNWKEGIASVGGSDNDYLQKGSRMMGAANINTAPVASAYSSVAEDELPSFISREVNKVLMPAPVPPDGEQAMEELILSNIMPPDSGINTLDEASEQLLSDIQARLHVSMRDLFADLVQLQQECMRFEIQLNQKLLPAKSSLHKSEIDGRYDVAPSFVSSLRRSVEQKLGVYVNLGMRMRRLEEILTLEQTVSAAFRRCSAKSLHVYSDAEDASRHDLSHSSSVQARNTADDVMSTSSGNTTAGSRPCVAGRSREAAGRTGPSHATPRITGVRAPSNSAAPAIGPVAVTTSSTPTASPSVVNVSLGSYGRSAAGAGSGAHSALSASRTAPRGEDSSGAHSALSASRTAPRGEDSSGAHSALSASRTAPRGEDSSGAHSAL